MLMKLFTISSYGDEFLAGEMNDGRLVLMGLLCPKLVTVFFGADGQYTSCESHDLTMVPPRIGASGESGPYQIYDSAFRTSFAQDLDQLKRRIGFAERPINVQQFVIKSEWIGIDLLPGHLADFKENPTVIAGDAEEERIALQDSLDAWEKSGAFILWWGRDYWLSPDGEVEST